MPVVPNVVVADDRTAVPFGLLARASQVYERPDGRRCVVAFQWLPGADLRRTDLRIPVRHTEHVLRAGWEQCCVCAEPPVCDKTGWLYIGYMPPEGTPETQEYWWTAERAWAHPETLRPWIPIADPVTLVNA